ncbi:MULTISPECIES: TolC family protein [unclassified Acinetobacter]|uniref:TolC family protein n=1 Tax=unclassified Acinetobacter TaxID=196816 RepID=UPI002576375B|nr:MULTISPECIES: TolC family protein [unclassified Acinetobacter]MDM1759012.1 TolC family protein [Acinetobacter sp. 256-1]MDM1762289.1 TolC family protein [Acinetobacter sp. 251-1]
MCKAKYFTFSLKKMNACIGLSLCLNSVVYAETQSSYLQDMQKNIANFIRPKTDDSFSTVQLSQLSNFQVQPDPIYQQLPVVGVSSDMDTTAFEHTAEVQSHLNLQEAVQIAVKRNPVISQALASLAAQNANIDVAKAQYYPQLKAGLNTGDFTSSDRGSQLYTIEANQLLYDFGKVKSSVDTQKNKLEAEQANVLLNIDEIATETARSIIAVLRYRVLLNIAQDQVKGVSRLHEIARLRSEAGISSYADPVQAQSYVEYAKTYLLTQQNKLRQEEQKLKTLLGFDVSRTDFIIHDEFLKKSDLYNAPQLNTIPSMIAAQAEIEIAKSQKKQTELSRYPTVSLTASLNQALNGKNPSTGKQDDTDSSIGISMTSNFYQGGAVSSQIRSAAYAEQAARSKLNATYLNIMDSSQIARENIENMDKQIWVLIDRERSTAKTRELYEEQYKLGKRSILDLLSSEQSFHSSRAERESARYDIYDTLAMYINVMGKSRDIYQLNNTKIQGFEVQQ